MLVQPGGDGRSARAWTAAAIAFLLIVCGLTIGTNLGRSSRLTYHEAFVAQGAREMLAAGQWWHPTIGGLPWLEKPPLPFWLVAGAGWCFGAVSPLAARLPAATAAVLMVLGLAWLAGRHYGSTIGLLAGAVQATTAWCVLRGRLAEADILLACLITWTLLAFDRLRAPGSDASAARAPGTPSEAPGTRGWRWAFFVLLGLTSLVKGVGFGAVLVGSVVLGVLVWDRDRLAARRLKFPAGWIVAACLALAWPIAMLGKHGAGALELWTLHIAGRVAPRGGHGPFAGEAWGEYALNVLGQALPWTPLAAVGAGASLGRALGVGRWARRALGAEPPARRADRLLACWGVIPLILVSLPVGRNAHYAIHALVPWSVWAALGLDLAGRRRLAAGWRPARLRRLVLGGFLGIASVYALVYGLGGRWLDRRGVEWGFYEQVGQHVGPSEPLALLYDDWDRDPYPTPFGPIPHDLGVRLYYLNRAACWHFGAAAIVDHAAGCHRPISGGGRLPSLLVLGRARDLPALARAGRVEVLAEGPAVRWDRTYVAARLWPVRDTAATAALDAAPPR